MCKFSDNGLCNYEIKFSKWMLSFPNELDGMSNLLLDPENYCLFHSKDLIWKRKVEFYKYFLKYINLSQKDNEVDSIDFSNSVTIGNQSNIIDLSNFMFLKTLRIKFSIFEDFTDFRNSIFNEAVDIYKTQFKSNTHFNKTKFNNRTLINNCLFHKPIYFNDSEFISQNRDCYLSFTESTFNEQANFSDTKFLGKGTDVNFQLVKFNHNVYFTASKFERHAIFNGSQFGGNADFRTVLFENGVLFNERMQNDTLNIVKFNNVDFTNTNFINETSFNQARIDKCLFKNTIFNGNISFNNSTIGYADFDKILLEGESFLLFRGVLDNKIFNKRVNFQIDREKIKGKISFENSKISWIDRPQVDYLLELQKENKVYFDNDCEFEANTKIVIYEIIEGVGNYFLFTRVFQGLEHWIQTFTNGIQISLNIEPSNKINEFKIKLVWQRSEDYSLFQTLSKYYFDCLDEKNELKIIEKIEKISNINFLKTFSNSENKRYSNISSHLKNIIDSVVNDFNNYLKNCEIADNSNNKSLSERSDAIKIDTFPTERLFVEEFLKSINNLISALVENNSNQQLTINIMSKSNTIINNGQITGSVNQDNKNSKLAHLENLKKNNEEPPKKWFSSIPEWAKILAGLGAIAGLIKVIIDNL